MTDTKNTTSTINTNSHKLTWKEWDKYAQTADGKAPDGRIVWSYRAFADLIGNFILCNEYPKIRFEHMELENGTDYDEEDDYYYEIFQYFIVGDCAYEQWKMDFIKMTDSILWYDDEMGLYILGVTHWGTSWRIVRGPDFTEEPPEWFKHKYTGWDYTESYYKSDDTDDDTDDDTEEEE